MTKQHFKAIAEALRNARPADGTGIDVHKAWLKAVTEVERALRQFNPRFKSHTFQAACGVGGD